MKFARMFVVAAILAVILAPAVAEAQSSRHAQRLIEAHAEHYAPNYRPLRAYPPPMIYGGYYGGGYGYQSRSAYGSGYGYDRGYGNYSRPATQRDVRGWGIGNAAVSLGTGIWSALEARGARKSSERIEIMIANPAPAPYYEQPAPRAEPREERSPEMVTVLNCTGVKVFLGSLETGLGKDLQPGQETEWLSDVPVTAYKRSDEGLTQVTVTWEGKTAVLR